MLCNLTSPPFLKDNGWSPLHRAVPNGHETVVALLLSNGANVNQADHRGASPLLIAAYKGQEAVATVLLSQGANINQAVKTGWFPLHVAAFNGHDAVVAVLLSMGADVNQTDEDGQKPIDVATTQKIKDMFIAHAKEKQVQEQRGNELAEQQQLPPKDEAPSNGQAVPTMVDESQWFQAAEQGELSLIQQGINDKIDVNCRDSKGRTAVYWAAKEGHIGLVEYLISQHADLHIADVSGDDVLLCCVVNNYPISTTSTLISTNIYPHFACCMPSPRYRTMATPPSIRLLPMAMRLWLLNYCPRMSMSTRPIIRASPPSILLL